MEPARGPHHGVARDRALDVEIVLDHQWSGDRSPQRLHRTTANVMNV
jgi:hypothetical protein